LHRYIHILKNWGQCRYFFLKHTKMHIKSIITVSPKNYTPLRDSNPGLLFLRRMQCPLRNAARVGDSLLFTSQKL
jgi:hypothetical protein